MRRVDEALRRWRQAEGRLADLDRRGAAPDLIEAAILEAEELRDLYLDEVDHHR